MKTGKLSFDEYVRYWKEIHERTEDDLAAVCFPHKPRYFNLFFDRTQKYAVGLYLRKERVGLNGKKLLDLGCGRGRWLSYFRDRHGAEVAGVDLSEKAVESCRAKEFTVRHASITDLPFDDGSFDAISSITVLLHVPYETKEQAVAEIARVLKPGGKAILLENSWQDPSPHVYSLSLKEWSDLFERHRMAMIHRTAHCFNLVRTTLPSVSPLVDIISIYFDYPLEYALMNLYYGKSSSRSLQHLMVFEKLDS